MRPPTLSLLDDKDGLTLFGLGRIPRCTECDRYEALVGAYRRAKAGGSLPSVLPAVPASCHFPCCAPLALRLVRDAAA